ncbi:MAG: DUF547 domain-containing protein, partial [Xanthomonadales bacterium]|nr:DUF547 domain-containing protein [Xanthomonadales bacterium]
MTHRLRLALPGAFKACVIGIALVSCAGTPQTPEPPPPVEAVDSAAVPEPFWDSNPISNFTINYADVDAILNTLVVDVGRSDRAKLPAATAQTGTRLQKKVKRSTGNEGNRFFFEEVKHNGEYARILAEVRHSLEEIPSQIPLEHFSRDEQLAYWLNLYNIALLEQLVQLYPERNLKKELTGRNSILSRKILTVAGIPLSLDDVQHTILRWNYDDNPIVIYGLYQGIIGGPSIRTHAFTGHRVYAQLRDNADEFINSNRGTSASGDGRFHVSSFYKRNRGWFEDVDDHLRQHLLAFLDEPQRRQLREADAIVADIDDWTITDVFGAQDQITGSFAHNPAAVLGAVQQVDNADVLLDLTVNTDFAGPDSVRF